MSVCVSPLVQPTTLMTELETLTCPQCPKSFTSTKMLQQHQQMFHTDKSILFTLKSTDAQAGMDRAFICETCGKAFRFRSNLAEHRSVHTALKPYVCKFCGKSSRLKGNLTKHILKHHKKEQNEAIAKDDIIVKKAPKVIKTEPGTSSNGTTATTSTATTATAVIITSSTGTNGNSQNGHNNNNNHNTINNNLTTIKTEIEDPDYVSMAVPTKSTTFAAKVVPSSPTKSRAQQRDTSVVPNIPTPVMIVEAQPEESSFLPKDLTTDFERNILISLGLDFATSMKIPESMKPAKTIKKELAASPDSTHHCRICQRYSYCTHHFFLIFCSVGGSETLAMIFAAANASIQQQQQLQQRRASSPDSTLSMRGGSPSREVSPESDESTSSNESCPSPTKFLTCKECGKIIRKSSHLPIHMTLSHGFPPPAATVDI
ncbi:LOW QUALITY PROTEIN: Protein CBR-SYD-9, partial [Caenorhabditis briggsae]